MECEEILERLKSLASPEAVAGMARCGINPQNTLGVSIPVLRKMAREIGRSHGLAQELWSSGVHEALRDLKPENPLVGIDSVATRDEIELEMLL
jgi:3-methyladenine DNA glycosylase AlkD